MSPRVLHVAQPTTGGVAHYLLPLVADQLGRGWDPVLACPDDGWLAVQAAGAGVERLPWPARRSPGPSVPGEVAALRRIVRRTRPDLVHLHSSKAGLAGRLLLRGRVPTLFQPHGWSWLAAEGPARAVSRWWEGAAGRWCDRLVCVSAAERDLGVAVGVRGRWAVVQSGVDLDRFRPVPAATRHSIRRRLGFSGPLAVCVGRLSEAKGQDLLAGCWPAVRDAVPAAELALVGDGEWREPVARLAGPGVRLVGNRDDVPDWYAAADVVVVPSRWDALSLSLVEAAAAGACIVATDVPGAREVLGPGAAAVVPPGDPEALGAAVAARLTDGRLAARERRANAGRARERFDRERAMRDLADLVMTVLSERAAAPPSRAGTP